MGEQANAKAAYGSNDAKDSDDELVIAIRLLGGATAGQPSS